MIDSPSFSLVLTLLNNEGFSTLIDQRCAADAFKAPTSAPETAPQSFDSIATVVPLAANSERKTKLANLLAVMTRQAHVIGNGAHPPNEYLVAMDQNVRELEAFSAVVYSSNFDLELLGAKKNAVPTRETDLVDNEPASSSFSQVIIEKDVEADSKEEIIEPQPRSLVPGEPAFNEPEPEPLAESAFEEAWGKATDDGKTSPTGENQPTQ